VSSELYAEDLRQYGQTYIVRPPVELHRFVFGKKSRTHRPVVGLSGYTYGDGRKGENMVKQLSVSPLGKLLKLQASGRGWPVPTQMYPWADMHKFYQSLDVYLCTALIEGIPMTPLEAMACGVRVVVPRGVGIMDELPDIPDIYRYRAGNYEDMANTVESAAFDQRLVDKAQLRAAVEQYNVSNWCTDHEKAVTDFMVSKVKPTELPNWRDRAGLYMVAYGEPSRECAITAINSFKQHMPGVPVALASDRPLGPEDILVQEPEVDIGARSAKVRIYELTPKEWEYILYLDADTEVVADIGHLFQILQDGWDFAICKNPQRYHIARYMVRPDNKDECKATIDLWGTDEIMQWNGGVFSFRRSRTMEKFFKLWHKEWQQWGKRDQQSLLRVLWELPVKVFWLGNQWNSVERYVLPRTRENLVNYSAGILHYPETARRHKGIVWNRGDSDEAWEKVAEFERGRK